MSTLKTQPTGADVSVFLSAIPDPQRREDSLRLLELMIEATGETPRMWGSSIVGFGDYHYHYDSGREGDWFLVGFSPRKNDLTLYLATGVDRFPELMARLGKHKTGKSCLYVKRLADIDLEALRELLRNTIASMPGGAKKQSPQK